MLIDFEYVFNNDCFYDFVIWVGEYFFFEEVECEIIEEYFGCYDMCVYVCFIVYKVFVDIKWSIWVMVQNWIFMFDFDFYKYGIWKYMWVCFIIYDLCWLLFFKVF